MNLQYHLNDDVDTIDIYEEMDVDQDPYNSILATPKTTTTFNDEEITMTDIEQNYFCSDTLEYNQNDRTPISSSNLGTLSSFSESPISSSSFNNNNETLMNNDMCQILDDILSDNNEVLVRDYLPTSFFPVNETEFMEYIKEFGNQTSRSDYNVQSMMESDIVTNMKGGENCKIILNFSDWYDNDAEILLLSQIITISSILEPVGSNGRCTRNSEQSVEEVAHNILSAPTKIRKTRLKPKINSHSVSTSTNDGESNTNHANRYVPIIKIHANSKKIIHAKNVQTQQHQNKCKKVIIRKNDTITRKKVV